MSKGSKAVAPSRGRSPNQPAAPVVQRGNGSSSYANSRTPVHKNFDRHPHVGAKKEKD
jgi:hypothetical protein